jgi:ribosomal 30S subunit maturation factor RimM
LYLLQMGVIGSSLSMQGWTRIFNNAQEEEEE